MKEIGQKLTMGIGTLNPIISRMHRNEWVVRERSWNDERIVLISLYGKAIKKKENIINGIATKFEECGLDIEEYEALMKYVSKLDTKLKNL